jgi:hypothetical protein
VTLETLWLILPAITLLVLPLFGRLSFIPAVARRAIAVTLWALSNASVVHTALTVEVATFPGADEILVRAAPALVFIALLVYALGFALGDIQDHP